MVTSPGSLRWRRSGKPRRGLTVFLVLLVIGMLFAVGTFAAKMASSGVANSGRFRQMVQTHYVSEMGMQASLAELQRDPNGYRIMLRDNPPPGGAAGEFPCKETPDPDGSGALKPANPACVRVGYTGFQTVARAQTANPGLDILEPKGAQVNGLSGPPGSLGHGNFAGNFAAELTDLMVDAPPPGFPAEQLSHMAFYRLTILATGQVLPWNTATNAPFAINSDQFEFMVSQEETRAQVVFGPVPR
jgi:hypothetical protein